jgi:hypothetical protein
VRSHYTIRPRTDSDIEDYADYLVRNASLDVALRFLAAADETDFPFPPLTQPDTGWHGAAKYPRLATLRMFRVAAPHYSEVGSSRPCGFHFDRQAAGSH